MELGFDSSRFVRAYESLTKDDHETYKKANMLRRQKRLHSVFSRNGKVFVKLSPTTEPPIYVQSIAAIEKITSTVVVVT